MSAARAALAALWVGVGCREAGGPGARALLDEPSIAPVDRMDGARWISVTARQPGFLVIRHDDGVEERTSTSAAASAAHEGALVGLRPGEHTLWLGLADAPGAPWRDEVGPLRFTVEAPRFVNLDVLAHDPAAVAEGWLLVSLTEFRGGPTRLLMLDEALDVVWWADPVPDLAEVRWTDRGTIRGTGSGHVVEVDLLGRAVSLVRPSVGALHHDVAVRDDGSFLTMVDASVEVPAYPVAYDALDTFAPAQLRDLLVVDCDPDGSVRRQVSIASLLDTERIGFDALTPTPWGLDWVHGNGLTLTPDDGVVVSLRHHDALVKLDAELALDWVLADPAGWRAPWSDRLLQPLGEVRWPYHTHAPEWVGDDLLLVYDNHNFGHTPYTEPPDGEPVSRAVGFRIDPVARTVSEAWSIDETATGPLFSRAVGDVDLAPTGQVLIDHGFVASENGLPNREAGRGHLAVRVVEARPSAAAPALDLRLWTEAQRQPDGVFAYRIERVPPAYGWVERFAPTVALPQGR